MLLVLFLGQLTDGMDVMRSMAFDEPALKQETVQEQIYKEYLPLVQSLARRIHRRLPQNVELDDLISAGMLGLLEASCKFDPTKRVDFSSYAYRRIQGAIVDSLRDLDWAPRALRRRAREMQEVIRVLSARLYRVPTEEEVASELHLSLSEYQRLLGDLASLEIGPLHHKVHDDSNDEEFVHLPSPEEDSPLSTYLRGELETRLIHAIEGLSGRERTIVHLYFNKGMSRTDIAEVLGVSAVEVGRIRASAILSLRAAINSETVKQRKAPLPFRRARSRSNRYVQIDSSAA